MRFTDVFKPGAALALLAAGLVLAMPPPADAQRISLQDLLDRIEALEGDGTEVKIAEVSTAFGDASCKPPARINPDTIEIQGANFDRAKDGSGVYPDPIVTFGNLGKLVLCPEPRNPTAADENPTATRLRAALPANVPAGDYLVTVSVGDGVGDKAEHLHTIGAVGPQGVQGPQGPSGANVRLEKFFEERTVSCTYIAISGSEFFPRCTCSCFAGSPSSGPFDNANFGTCDCDCTSTARVTANKSSCTATAPPFTCPIDPQSQVKSTLLGCSGNLAAGDTCPTSSFLTGSSSSCSASDTKSCTCSCGASGDNCTCGCNPSGSVSCVGQERTATRFETAICIKTVPVAGGG